MSVEYCRLDLREWYEFASPNLREWQEFVSPAPARRNIARKCFLW